VSDHPPVDPGKGVAAIAIPYAALSAQALRGVVESFVLREGTDYGEHECSLEQKIRHVMTQLERAEAQILFDPVTETIDIVRLEPAGRYRPDSR